MSFCDHCRHLGIGNLSVQISTASIKYSGAGSCKRLRRSVLTKQKSASCSEPGTCQFSTDSATAVKPLADCKNRGGIERLAQRRRVKMTERRQWVNIFIVYRFGQSLPASILGSQIKDYCISNRVRYRSSIAVARSVQAKQTSKAKISILQRLGCCFADCLGVPR